METEAMYGDRDVASMTPRIFDRGSYRMPGSAGQNCKRCAIWHGLASSPDFTGSVYGRAPKEVTGTLLKGGVRRLYNITQEMIRHE